MFKQKKKNRAVHKEKQGSTWTVRRRIIIVISQSWTVISSVMHNFNLALRTGTTVLTSDGIPHLYA